MFAYVGRNQNLKDLKDQQKKERPPSERFLIGPMPDEQTPLSGATLPLTPTIPTSTHKPHFLLELAPSAHRQFDLFF